MKEIWNERYDSDNYIYGKTPNVFFAEQLNKLDPGTIILPCEGEGRNAVFAATKGWDVIAFDQSEVGKKKVLELAHQNNTVIDYKISDALDFYVPEETVDAVAFIYAHFPTAIRKTIHQKAIGWLKQRGILIIEAFTPAQIKNHSGGPKDISMLYTEAMLQEDFRLMNIELLQPLQVELKEGNLHDGIAEVIRFIGRKK